MGRGERDTVARGARLYEVAQAVIGDHGRAVEAVRAALKPIHDAAVKRELDAIPVIRLQDVTEGRLRLGSVEKSRLRTVGSVAAAGRPPCARPGRTCWARSRATAFDN